jgi:ribosomal protein S16
MPYQCPTGKRCLNTSAGTYDPATDAPASTASEVNRIEYWITHGALP